MAAPSELTVQQVVKTDTWTGNDGTAMATDEVVFLELEGRTYKLHRPASDPAPQQGEKERGWTNPDGKFNRARQRQGTNSSSTSTADRRNSGRDDATGRSIERQVAAYAASYMACAAGGPAPTMVANFEAMFDVVHARIVGKPATVSEPAQDADIPFN
jgi:hypothetical protein